MRLIIAILIAFLLGLLVGISIVLLLHKENICAFLKSINDNYASTLSAISSIGLLLVAIAMCFTLVQNSYILRQNTQALQLQKKDFQLRNRPLIDATHARFGGPITSHEGYKFPHSVEIALENKTAIPATQFKATCIVMIDHKKVAQNIIDVGTLVQGTPWEGTVFITKNIYLDATVNKKKFSIDVVATYSGMLGEKPDEYGTSFIINYFPNQKDFRFAKKKFK